MVRVCVLGAGLMGQKIAGLCAMHGHDVRIYDVNLNTLNSLFERLERDKIHLQEHGLLSDKHFVGQVICLSRLEDAISSSDFVFEAVSEELDLKHDLFSRISELCQPTSVLATNTLRICVDDIFSDVSQPERALGVRFLFPVYYVSEVEITPSSLTSSKTIEKVRLFMERMGKTLYFRSGDEPLILNESQRDDRRRDCISRTISSRASADNRTSTLPNVGAAAPCVDRADSASLCSLSRDCAICMDRSRNCVLAPCHHMVTCCDCASALLRRHDACPICRKTIAEVIKVFHS